MFSHFLAVNPDLEIDFRGGIVKYIEGLRMQSYVHTLWVCMSAPSLHRVY